jgi:hypothetical protein
MPPPVIFMFMAPARGEPLRPRKLFFQCGEELPE